MANKNYTFSLNGHVSRGLIDELILEHGYDGSIVYEYSPEVGTDITLSTSKNDLEVDETFRTMLDQVGVSFRI